MNDSSPLLIGISSCLLGENVRYDGQHKLERLELCGFIFKSHSPSSGMRGVKVYKPGGGAAKNGVGLFARAFMERFPLLPVEDEGRLHDAGLKENFIKRIFIFKRWKDLIHPGISRKGLIPLIVPVTLFNHFVRKYQEPYLRRQFYLNPHPLELMLRNHV